MENLFEKKFMTEVVISQGGTAVVKSPRTGEEIALPTWSLSKLTGITADELRRGMKIRILFSTTDFRNIVNYSSPFSNDWGRHRISPDGLDEWIATEQKYAIEYGENTRSFAKLVRCCVEHGRQRYYRDCLVTA